jgi:hypothetical protein
MKIRNGFVSNSSSSSFLIYGIETNVEKLRKLIKPESELWGTLETHNISYNLKNEGSFNAN